MDSTASPRPLATAAPPAEVCARASEKLKRFAGVGGVLANKYRVERVLGSGGMGFVVAARPLHSRREVAIKFPLPMVSRDEQRLAWFRREARAARTIASSHVVRVLDVDVRDDGVPYFVMELLEGETLASFIRKRGRLRVADAVDYLLEVSAAVAAAHATGIVHRDLKPTNVFLAHDSEHEQTVKLLDFGISKGVADDPSASAGDDMWCGSPPYMSPEQLTAPQNVDRRTDIWGLGTILYECLTGTSPFLLGRPEQLFVRILQEPAAPIATFRTDVPDALEQVVRHCLAKAKQHRFATIADFAHALAPLSSSRARRPLWLIDTSFQHVRLPETAPQEPRPAVRSTAPFALPTRVEATLSVATSRCAACGRPSRV
ncbi:MAG TPA: serine/threonine-protein kinase [Polyangiaceae bacterium]